MLHPLEIEELERRASQGEVVIPGGTGGKSLEAQIQLAEGKETIVLSNCPIAQNLSFPQNFTTPPCWALLSTCLMSAPQWACMGLDMIEVFWFLANLLVESLLRVHIAKSSILSSPSACSLMLADWRWALHGLGFNWSSLDPWKLDNCVGCKSISILVRPLASTLMLADWRWALHGPGFDWSSLYHWKLATCMGCNPPPLQAILCWQAGGEHYMGWDLIEVVLYCRKLC